jgi:ATP-binding cassette subfamily B protein
MRFYDATGGQITYDGLPLETIEKASLRRSFSMVLQDTHLFTGTVRENIRFGRPNASDEDVLAAAKLASAHFFISHLPQGYDTVLEADGGNLSAGQRQLIAIARSAIADPAVLLLDEATAAVDTWTERQIEQGLDRLMEGKTVFIIAHRLSTVRNADCILVLEHGQILEQGTHETLLQQRGRYYDLYTGSAELT